MSFQVRVIARKSKYKGKEYPTYYVNVPAALAKLLKIGENDFLNCTITEVTINGKRVKALIYWKE